MTSRSKYTLEVKDTETVLYVKKMGSVLKSIEMKLLDPQYQMDALSQINQIT